MAQQKFPFPTLVSNSVAPASGGAVTVPLQNPALAEQSQLYGDLSKRIDAVSQMGFKIAGERAKMAGTLYGARNAPTFEQMQLAAKSGQPINLPGDASSINIFQQAAYAGSIAVTESQFIAQGRRALSEEMAAAAMDNNMDPQKFTAKLDNIIDERSKLMSQISLSSGAKVSASLASMANGQIVSYSRTYATKLKKAIKDDAYSALGDIQDGFSTLIDGYVPPTENDLKTAELNGEKIATLEEIYKSNRSEAENLLINSGESQKTVNSQLKQLDKNWVKAQKNAVVAWSQKDDYANDTGAAYIDLTNGEAPLRINNIFKNLSSSDQVAVLSDMMKIHKQQESLEDAEAADNKAAIEETAIGIERQINIALGKNDANEVNSLLEQLNKVDPKRATTLRDEKNIGPITRNIATVVESIEDDIADPAYDEKVEAGTKTAILKRIASARKNKHITADKAQTLRTRVFQTQDDQLKIAINDAAIAFNYDYDTFAMDPRLDKYDNQKKYKMAENEIREIFNKNPEVNLREEMVKIIKNVNDSTKEPFATLLGKLPQKYNTKAKWVELVKLAERNPTKYKTTFFTYKSMIDKIKRMYPDEWNNTNND